MPTQTVPDDLSRAGRALWDDITGKYALRADEQRLVEDAAREADLIALLDSALRGEPLLVRGSQGQEVINPLVSELRQHRATLAALLRQLKLPDDNPASAGDRSAQMRQVANARWSKRGG